MSNAKKCDRCGKFYMPGHERQKLLRPDSTHIHDYFDFCPDCDDDLVSWMNNYQTVIEAVDHDR